MSVGTLTLRSGGRALAALPSARKPLTDFCRSAAVNLLYLFDVERIHAFDRNRSAVQIKCDPL
jgi:hypothetical protein